ncbi:MAG TPA: BON domain-containing protein [Candidatus Acidoferrales bacterium]|nr:BON domain-containing protein [Candidatus Acidoferrales bacterium]
MSSKIKILVLAQSVILGIWLAPPVFAQTGGTSASDSMHQAGENTESAAKNAYHGTVTALDDTRITTAVKTELAAAKDLRSGQIHVTTTAGVVTLRGTVHDSAVASRAEAIARNASGVRGVKNHLKVSSSVPKD